ncbi:MAG: hypothetical protein NVSMB64_05780 [Candidatus Velthaea sp.]
MFAKGMGACAAAVFVLLAADTASAIPIFAQRYALQCGACHSVLPELNAFGNAFRNRGYRLPAAKHGTTVIAVRYQMEYDRDPAPNAPRFVPGGVLLSNADAGAISAFLHYNIGAQGGPSGTYLAFLSRYVPATRSLYRLGLFELPLIHSPGQRLDDLAPYGYEQTHVGLNDLTLAQPRLGLEAERTVGRVRIAATASLAEFKGAAYGGRPIDTGTATRPDRPEFGAFVRAPVGRDVVISGEGLFGARAIAPAARPTFVDTYRRTALGIEAQRGHFGLLAQQWWGVDGDDDGFGTRAASYGGFARVRYALGDHAYLGVRYDSAAAPTALRDTIVYAATHLGRHARPLLENKHVQHGKSTLEGALTVGVPWPAKQ